MRLGVVIFGQMQDPHVGRVVAQLHNIGLQARVFDIYRDQVSMRFEDGQGDIWPLADFIGGLDGVAIWNRQKRPIGDVRGEWLWGEIIDGNTLEQYQTAKFWKAEWAMLRMAAQAALLGHPHVRLINPGTATAYAGLKPVQLSLAKEAGFSVPRTVMGNDLEAVRATFGESMLYKPLSGEAITGIGNPPPAILRTNDLLMSDLVNIAPGIFQDKIEKSFELRVTVCGSEVTAVKIDSQSINISKLDWRKAQHRSEIYSMYDVDEALHSAITRYMRLANLDFGAMDLAITPGGGCVFFECNPEGQWLWMEEHLNLSITKAAARMLAAVASRAATESQVRGNVAETFPLAVAMS